MKKFAIVLAIAATTVAGPAAATQAQAGGGRASGATPPGRLTLYNQTNYSGQAMEIDGQRRVLRWDYRPRSIAIYPGDRWEICARPRFAECITLERSVPDTTMIGIPVGAAIGSLRPAPAAAAAPRGN